MHWNPVPDAASPIWLPPLSKRIQTPIHNMQRKAYGEAGVSPIYKKTQEKGNTENKACLCCLIDLGLLLEVANAFLLRRKELLPSHHQHMKLGCFFTISALMSLEFPAINSWVFKMLHVELVEYKVQWCGIWLCVLNRRILCKAVLCLQDNLLSFN